MRDCFDLMIAYNVRRLPGRLSYHSKTKKNKKSKQKTPPQPPPPSPPPPPPPTTTTTTTTKLQNRYTAHVKDLVVCIRVLSLLIAFK